MSERIFTDKNGEQLIVQNRKSAVFFLRETDLSIDGYVSVYWSDKTPVFDPNEMKRNYCFTEETFECFTNYLEQIAHDSWKNFNPKEADSLGADYAEYYDRDFDTEGYIRITENNLLIEGPYQPKNNNPFIRLYKFNKRKFESFIFDLRKITSEKQIC